jgi:chemotaxis protein MotA
MNKSVLVGSIGGVVLVAGVLLLSAGNLGAFFSIPGLIVVLGGTLLATLVSRPVNEVRELIESIPALFRPEESTMARDVEQLLKFARRYRVCDARAAERELVSISNPFVATGLRQVVEGCGLEDLGKSLQWRIAGERSKENGQTQILYSMATFAPAFGMLGTLFGLVHMLTGLGEAALNDIGSSMAFAMITTVYGIIASNLLFKPLAIKRERRTTQHLMQMTALMEGILQIHQKRHPMLISDALEAYTAHYQSSDPMSSSPLTLVKA